MLKRMHGFQSDRNDKTGFKNTGQEINKQAKAEYQAKLKEYHEKFGKYEKELSNRDIQGWDLKF